MTGNAIDIRYATAVLTAFPKSLTNISLAKDLYQRLKMSSEPKQLEAFSQVERDHWRVDGRKCITPELELRHRAIDRLVELQQTDVFVELGAGFGSRALSMSLTSGKRTLDVDLDSVIDHKSRVLMTEPFASMRHSERFSILRGDVLLEETWEELREWIGTSRVCFVCEGLLRYFRKEEKSTIAGNIGSILRSVGGAWITIDVTMRSHLDGQMTSGFHSAARLDKYVSNRDDDFSFLDAESAAKFYANASGLAANVGTSEGIFINPTSQGNWSHCDLSKIRELVRTVLLRPK